MDKINFQNEAKTNEENLLNVFYTAVHLMFFHFRIQLKRQCISWIIIVLSNTEYSFMWKNDLWAQFCTVDVNRNCFVNF